MNLAVPIGRDPPNEVNVVIEAPIGGEPTNYEMHKESGALMAPRTRTPAQATSARNRANSGSNLAGASQNGA